MISGRIKNDKQNSCQKLIKRVENVERNCFVRKAAESESRKLPNAIGVQW